uniref:Replication-associated protein n=1 Tax=Urochloa streak virus TaxID=520848 RepID=B3FVZ8_9GEMI|nr:replication associated protein [Urochloa streak virus]
MGWVGFRRELSRHRVWGEQIAPRLELMATVGSSSNSVASRSFKHRNANTYLTYPKCPLEPEAIGLTLWSLIAPWEPAYIIVCREAHQDGTWHCHALAQSVKPVTTRNSRFFDIEDHHPNIQSAKSVDKVRAYILKDPIALWERGTFIPRKKSFVPHQGDEHTPKPTKDDIVRDIIEHSTSKQEYLSRLQNELPYEWATKLQYFEYSANKLFPDIPEPYIHPHPQTEPELHCKETIDDWLKPNIFQVHPDAYMLINNCTREQAESDLVWLDDVTHSNYLQTESRASTSSGLQGQGNQHGLEA